MFFDPSQLSTSSHSIPQHHMNPTPDTHHMISASSSTQYAASGGDLPAGASMSTQGVYDRGSAMQHEQANKRRKLIRSIKEYEKEEQAPAAAADRSTRQQNGSSAAESSAHHENGNSSSTATSGETSHFHPSEEFLFQWACFQVEKQCFWMTLDACKRAFEGTLLANAVSKGESDESIGVYVPAACAAAAANSRRQTKRKQDLYVYLPNRDPHLWQIIWSYFKTGQLLHVEQINTRIVGALKEEAVFFKLHKLETALKERSVDWREYIVLRGNADSIRIRGMTLRASDLSPLNLSSIDFTSCKFLSCSLRGADLSHARMDNTYFMGSNLDSARARNTSMKRIHAKECGFDRTIFIESQLSGRIERSTFSKVLFEKTSLDVKLKDVSFQNCSFVDSSFGEQPKNSQGKSSTGAENTMENTSFYKCSFTNVDLSNMNPKMKGATFNRCVFDGCRVNTDDKHEIDWSGSNFRKCQFLNSNLGSIDFSDSTLESCVITQSDFSKCTFTSAHLHSLKVLESNLSQINFTQARMQFVDMCQVKLITGVFVSADLTGAVLERCDLSLSDFSLTDMRGVKRISCQTNGCLNIGENKVPQQGKRAPLNTSGSPSNRSLFKSPKKNQARERHHSSVSPKHLENSKQDTEKQSPSSNAQKRAIQSKKSHHNGTGARVTERSDSNTTSIIKADSRKRNRPAMPKIILTQEEDEHSPESEDASDMVGFDTLENQRTLTQIMQRR